MLYDDALDAFLLAGERGAHRTGFSLLFSPTFHPEVALHLERPCDGVCPWALRCCVAQTSIAGYIDALESTSPARLATLAAPAILVEEWPVDDDCAATLRGLSQAIVAPAPGPSGRDGMHLTLIHSVDPTSRLTLSTASYDRVLPGHAPLLALALGLVRAASGRAKTHGVAGALRTVASYLSEV
jgi:hypothetical protein